MTTRALFRCDGARVPRRWEADDRWDVEANIRHRGPDPSHNLRIQSLDYALLSDLKGRATDLVRIGACIYAADQMVSRETPADLYRKRWRRSMALAIPVSEPRFWEERIGRLIRVLEFVSEDEWEFSFSAAPPDEVTVPLDITSEEAFSGADTVIMFSGGMDSLCATVGATFDHGRRPVLVSHASNPASWRRQADLIGELSRSTSDWGRGREWPHVVGHIHRRGSDALDFNQRTRPFLYACPGAAIAAGLGTSTVLLPDNGVVGINLPLVGDVYGALSARRGRISDGTFH
jgi:hypothetical protein